MANQVPGHDHCIQAELAAALALSTSLLCTRKRECEESVDTVATKSLCVNAEVASSSRAAVTERFVIPVPLVGMAGSYLEQPEYDAFIATVLQVLSKDDSKAAKEQTLQERDGASAAVLKNIEELIKDAKELTFEARSHAKRVDVHHLSGLNTIFKKCTSSKMLQQVIDFLAEHCPNLCSLDFSDVKLLTPEILRSLSRFQRLHSLSLAATDIQDEHVAALSNLPLKMCDLKATEITGSTLSSLHRGIEDLNLYYCRNLTDAGVEGLGRKVDERGQVLHEAMQLKTCNLSYALITGSTLSSLHRGIENLYLDCCTLLTDAGVEGLGRKVDGAGIVIHEAMQLKKCGLCHDSITGSTFSSLHRGIEDLNLWGCRNLTDAGAEGLGRKVDEAGIVIHEAMQLKECALSYTSITGSTFSSLHRGIEDLSLQGCRNLTDAGVEGLGRKVDEAGKVIHEAMQLKKCDLGWTPITGSTLSSLHRGIENLNLDYCRNLTDAGVGGAGRKVDEI